ncbi:MAG: 3'-5' exoribonuclease [Microthrixaceae bacterium]|nr:3'-5' exoribonuclease [Microthrixaceae bacterium]
MAFAVVDFETTGILPSHHHRVVEIGITHVSDDGEITGRWETLVNPERDLGPQHIHGIRSSEILNAPTFSDVAGEFAELLQGRVFVAHNASFDLRFLHAEFERTGTAITGNTPHLCTMRLGTNFGLGPRASLARACERHGIELARAHTAGDDAHAAAQLLSSYRQSSATWPGWDEFWARTSQAGQLFVYPTGPRTGVPWQPRIDVSAEPPSFLERISAGTVNEEADGAATQYLALLDRCLLDGHISVSEGAQLAEAAAMLGLTRDSVASIHRDYFIELERRAWADDVLTDNEIADLRRVGTLLQLSEAEVKAAVDAERPTELSAVAQASFALRPGDVIVLTGDMARARSAWEADLLARGFRPHPTVTKKVTLVVAADPDSLSGKAKKARNYGIPIVSEDGLRRLLDQARP